MKTDKWVGKRKEKGMDEKSDEKITTRTKIKGSKKDEKKKDMRPGMRKRKVMKCDSGEKKKI